MTVFYDATLEKENSMFDQVFPFYF